MSSKRSLRFKLAIGFGLLSVPLLFILIYNNLAATSVVREQVAESNKNMVTLYSSQIQTSLSRETNFLYNLAMDDPNILALSDTRKSNDRIEYELAKNRILISLSRYHRYDSSVDVQFVYSTETKEMFNTVIRTLYLEEMDLIKQSIYDVVSKAEPDSPYLREWKLVSYGDKHALIRLVDSGYGYYLGAFVKLESLSVPLELIQLGQNGFSAFSDSGGSLVLASPLTRSEAGSLRVAPERDYQTLNLKQEDYLVVSNRVKDTDMTLSAFIPEQRLLQKLSKYRTYISLMPFLAGFLLLLCVLYLNHVIIKPMHTLIRGMRTIKRGDWKYRLSPARSTEFAIINETFNDMVQEIEELKINVYEEQIRVHKAELKQLQLQINPHFLLNSINVVYSLAQIRNFGLIQSMCLNLVKYFRFTTRISGSLVAVGEEMEHMDSYLRIQQLRFPGKIDFDIDIDEELEQQQLPPLLVQPFIENAVKHGFDFMDEPFRIGISVHYPGGAAAGAGEGGIREIFKESGGANGNEIGSEERAGTDGGGRSIVRSAATNGDGRSMERMMPTDGSSRSFQVVVEDNGSGFPEEVLKELQSGRRFEASGDEHLGIWNVHHRLKLLYGSSASLQFSNREAGGARIVIVLPLDGAHRNQSNGGGIDVSRVDRG